MGTSIKWSQWNKTVRSGVSIQLLSTCLWYMSMLWQSPNYGRFCGFIIPFIIFASGLLWPVSYPSRYNNTTGFGVVRWRSNLKYCNDRLLRAELLIVVEIKLHPQLGIRLAYYYIVLVNETYIKYGSHMYFHFQVENSSILRMNIGPRGLIILGYIKQGPAWCGNIMEL